jgi:hypothetical protein
MKIFNFINSLLVKSVHGAVSETTLTVLPFTIPSLPDVVGFVIKFFFIVAGLAALIYLILGAFAWITSGGNKESVEKAQQKIQAAVVGLIVLVAVLAIIVVVEKYVFGGKVCLGISCPIVIPTLIQP